MSYKNSKTSSGFTIIEVLIVLAIAGLILLIVFLAVPALQRNQRNTTAKNDAQNILGGIAEYQAANNGQLPTNVAGTGNIQYTGGTTTSIDVQGTTTVTRVAGAPTVGTGAGNLQPGQMFVVLGAKCATNTTTTPNSRAVSVFYAIETNGSTVTSQCASS
jgi:prepilin-type N-terminal cleavage/methylation domain-containing protein